jgi:hypothetical protein
VGSMINADGVRARQAIVNELVARIEENFGPGVYGAARMTEEIRTRFLVSGDEARSLYARSQPLKTFVARA